MMKYRSLSSLTAISIAILAAALWLPNVEAQVIKAETQVIKAEAPPEREFNPRVVMKQHLPPIENAPFILASKVTDQVADNELVLGVVVAGKSRAYPINMLTGPSRAIINDQLGGRAIAATW